MDFGVLNRHGRDSESQSVGVPIQNSIYANEILTMGSRRPSLANATTRHAWSSGSSDYTGDVDESRRPSVSEISDVGDLDYASKWHGGGGGSVSLSSKANAKRLFGSLTFGPLAIGNGNGNDEEKSSDGDGFMVPEEECARMSSSDKVPPTQMTSGSSRTTSSSHHSIPPNDARPTGAGGHDAHPSESLFGDYTWGHNHLVSVSKPRQLHPALGVSEVGPLDDHASRVSVGPSTATTDLEPESERTMRRGFEGLNVESVSPFQ